MLIKTQDGKRILKVNGVAVEGQFVKGQLFDCWVILGKYNDEDEATGVLNKLMYVLNNCYIKDTLQGKSRYTGYNVFVMPSTKEVQ